MADQTRPELTTEGLIDMEYQKPKQETILRMEPASVINIAQKAPVMPDQPKKKPGRPKKRNEKLPIHGVMTEPPRPGIRAMYISSNPHEFRDLLEPFFDYRVRTISFIFEKDSFKLTSDHNNICIRANVMVAKTHRYYCSSCLLLNVTCDSLKKILQTIHAYTNVIEFLVEESHVSSKMSLILRDFTAGGEGRFEIATTKQNTGVLFTVKEELYPLRFTFPTDYFKLFVTKVISNLAPKLYIKKIGEGPLTFISGNEADKSTSWSYKFPNVERIGLISKLKDNDTIFVGVALETISPFASGKIGKRINILVDHVKPLVLMTVIEDSDNGCLIGEIFIIINISSQQAHKTEPSEITMTRTPDNA